MIHSRAVATTTVSTPEPDTRFMDSPEQARGAAQWMSRFVAIWDEPGDADRFADSFVEFLHPNVRLRQPPVLYPTCYGHKGFRDQFRRWMYTIPDLRGEVIRWCAMGDTAWIELDLQGGTTGSRPFSWRTVERVLMDGGLVTERHTFTDAVPAFLATFTRPSYWPRAWPYALPVRDRGPAPAREPVERRMPPPAPDDARLGDLNFPAEMSRYLHTVVEAYEEPGGDGDRFVDRFEPMTHPQARFIQPFLLYPNCQGIPALRKQFRRWFRGIPDLRADLVRWAVKPEGERDIVMMELMFHGYRDYKPYSFRSVERSIWEDGVIVERRTFTDPLPLLMAATLRPRYYHHLLRSYFP